MLLPTLFASCDSDNNDDVTGPPAGTVVIDLGRDSGVLNYAYALEQLEAAYYTRVVTGISSSGLTAAEQAVLTA